MKNDFTFVRMRKVDHLGHAKNVDKRHPASLFNEPAKDENAFCRIKEEGHIFQKSASDFYFSSQD